MQILNDTGLFDRTVTDITEWFFEGAEEIGSSDMSTCANTILHELGRDPKEATNEERWIVKNAIRNVLNQMA